MILSNFYKCCQALITFNDGDSYATIKSYNGSELSANIAYIYNGQGRGAMFESQSLIGTKSLTSYNYSYMLGSSNKPVTSEDYGITPLNADLTVTYLADKSSITHDTENHKVIVTRAWSLTNTSTSLPVEVNEIVYLNYGGIATWRELLNEQSFTLQPLQAGTFTMTLEYNLVDYASPVSSVNFLSEVR